MFLLVQERETLHMMVPKGIDARKKGWRDIVSRIYLSIYLSIYLFICLSIYLSIYLVCCTLLCI